MASRDGPARTASASTADGHAALGAALGRAGLHDEALAELGLALRMDPSCVAAHEGLGDVLRRVGLPLEAMASHRRALAQGGDEARAWHAIGLCLADAAEPEAAAAAFRRALAARAGFAAALVGLSAALHAMPATAPARLLALARGRAAGSPSEGLPAASRDTASDRLRVGYLSGGFSQRPTGWFLRSVLRHHDERRFEVRCYASQTERDALTEELIGAAARWDFVGTMDDATLARRIRADGVEVLVDLSGSGPGTRLGVFAHRAAPVQVSWLGPGTGPGADSTDAVVAGRALLPPGVASGFAGTVVELDCAPFAYDAPDYAPEPVEVPRDGPAFGCFAGLGGMHAGVIDAWSAILLAMPGSPLVLRDVALNDPRVRDNLARRFALRGVDAARLVLRGPVPHADHLAEHADIDVALDPFPASSAIATCEALWMGVPVVTMPALRPTSRLAAAALDAVGLRDLVAGTPRDYVARAVTIARDLGRRSRLRTRLREQVRASGIGDGRRVAGALEAAFTRLAAARQRSPA